MGQLIAQRQGARTDRVSGLGDRGSDRWVPGRPNARVVRYQRRTAP